MKTPGPWPREILGVGTSLPRRRAFLVQYASDADPCGDHLCGRVEHVESGRSRRFGSKQELEEFVVRLLSEESAGSNESCDAQGARSNG